MCLNDWIASFHQFWRGGLTFRLTMTGTAFHKVTLIVSSSYGNYSPPATGSVATASEITSQYYYTLDFDGADGQTCFEFEIPWHGTQQDWMRVPIFAGTSPDINFIKQCSLGCWFISLGSVLTYNGDVPTTVYFDLEQCGSPDMQYYDPLWAGSSYTFGNAAQPTALYENCDSQGKVVRVGPNKLPTAPEINSVVSECSTNFLDLIRRPQLCASFNYPTLLAPGTTDVIIQYVFDTGLGTYTAANISRYDNVINATTNPGSLTNLVTAAPLIQQLAANHRLFRGSLRFFVEVFPFKILLPSTAAPAYLGVEDSIENCEVEGYNDQGLYQTALPAGSFFFATAENQRRNAGASAYSTLAATTASSGNLPNRTILSPMQPRAGIEIPFHGITPFQVCGGFPASGALAFPSGTNRNNFYKTLNTETTIWIRWRQMCTGTTSATTTPRRVRIWVCAGDDFGFAHFLTVPQIYMNFMKPTSGTYIAIPPTWNVSTFSVSDTPTPKPVRLRKKKTVVLEVDESSSDESSIVLLPENARAQVLDYTAYDPLQVYQYSDTTTPPQNAVPGSFASFACYLRQILLTPNGSLHFPRALLTRPSSILAINFRSLTTQSQIQGPKLVYEAFIQGQAWRLELPNERLVLPNWTDDVLATLVDQMCRWAIVHANSVLSSSESVLAWLELNAETNVNKPPLSIFNELHAAGLIAELSVTESPAVGPLHNLQWPITVSITLPDGTNFTGTATVATKHASKRDAAQKCFDNMYAALKA